MSASEFSRRKYRLLETQRVSRGTLGPVVAIAPERDNGVRRIECTHALVERLLEPMLASDAPRFSQLTNVRHSP